ncbi:lecithin retinol acyltransferase family protein [Pseudomonas siliginis]|uniref:lecithin retinol acyltransferase family protein n=1 Tax=Pseudomonas siliginis TaxID=2842346 RepID=UPI0038646AC7
MTRLLSEITNYVSSIKTLRFLRSPVADENTASCLNCEVFENELRIRDSGIDPSTQVLGSAHLEWVGDDTDQIPAGSHLISPRKFYVHHGIYLGAGQVAHYSGLNSSLHAGPIVVTDLEHFASGRSVWLYQDQSSFTSEEIIVRARSRIGESQYKVFSNNCEHFCNWCIRGTSYSPQVSEYLHYPLRLIGLIVALGSDYIG